MFIAIFAAMSPKPLIQFALGVENLENAFYTEALGKFDEAAFKSAGFPPYVRGRFAQLAANEAQHVELLKKVLGNEAPAPCNYSYVLYDVCCSSLNIYRSNLDSHITTRNRSPLFPPSLKALASVHTRARCLS